MDGLRHPRRSQMVEQPVSFSEWVRSLEAVVHEKVGLGLKDLPAHDFLPEFEDGLTPEEAFDECIREELEEMGFHLAIADLFEEANLMVAERPCTLTLEEELELEQVLDNL
jgi:hypothetical protein